MPCFRTSSCTREDDSVAVGKEEILCDGPIIRRAIERGVYIEPQRTKAMVEQEAEASGFLLGPKQPAESTIGSSKQGVPKSGNRRCHPVRVAHVHGMSLFRRSCCFVAL